LSLGPPILASIAGDANRHTLKEGAPNEPEVTGISRLVPGSGGWYHT
jgi:hypothetical protein